jgi:hypothetical protein
MINTDALSTTVDTPKPGTTFWSAAGVIADFLALSQSGTGVYLLTVQPKRHGIASARRQTDYRTVLATNFLRTHSADQDLIIWDEATDITGGVMYAIQVKYAHNPPSKYSAFVDAVQDLWRSGHILIGESEPPSAIRSADADRDVLPARIAQLEVLLGTALAAYIAGVDETSTLAAWVSGRATPDNRTQRRIEVALEAARLIARHEDEGMAQAWFQGSNPLLSRSPAALLRSGDYTSDDVIDAAKAYLAS